jgi:sulfoxide reductase heme-binding subunit YedZ
MKFAFLRRIDRLAVNLICLVPGAVLAVLYFQGSLGPNPIQILERRTGDIALVLLLISLVFTPLRVMTGFNRGVKYRRITGLYAFYYAAAHFLIYIGLDYGFDFSLITLTILQTQFLWIGGIALIILISLAVTSTNGWKARLKRNWTRLHSLVYPAAVVVILHFALAKKGDLFRFRGEELYPLIALGVWVILMLLRLPPIRKRISRHR